MYGKLFTYISHTNQPNVGKYSIPMDPLGICPHHWPTGISRPQSLILFDLLCEPRCWGKKMIETGSNSPNDQCWYPTYGDEHEQFPTKDSENQAYIWLNSAKSVNSQVTKEIFQRYPVHILSSVKELHLCSAIWLCSPLVSKSSVLIYSSTQV